MLTDANITIKIAENMTWRGKHPVVTLMSKIYEKGIKLTQKTMAARVSSKARISPEPPCSLHAGA